ncbi:MAG TPA: helix-turn-helix domain-containing protein [Geminicoccaceae bacterium]|nr:helix-turn-helix domain-containing protein [Geminicoccaceae bacterium]
MPAQAVRAPEETPRSVYRERLPPAALADRVLCVWSQEIGEGMAELPHRVLPDGCIDIVWIGAAPAVVAGPATGPVVVPLAPRTTVVGVRLRPGVAPGLLGAPASALLNRDTPLGELWGTAADALSEQVVMQPALAARLDAAAAGLAGRLAAAGRPDPMIAAATVWLARHPAGRIADLCRRLEVGERQLHRWFTAAVGYGPKTFQRVLRLQRVLALADRLPRADAGLAALAVEAGYADQAHMSRELQALTGRSPAALLQRAASTLEMSDFFKTASDAVA